MRQMVGRCARLLGIAAAAGCGDASGGGGTDGSTGADLPPCLRSVQGTGWEFWNCYLPSPCADAVLAGPWGEEGVFLDRSAAECVAAALRDRQPARLQLDHDVGLMDGSSHETIFVLNQVDAVSNILIVNAVNERVITDRQLVQPPEYFDGCLGSTSDQALYDCLADWSRGCGDEPVACP